jgi:hypothetical protein
MPPPRHFGKGQEAPAPGHPHPGGAAARAGVLRLTPDAIAKGKARRESAGFLNVKGVHGGYFSSTVQYALSRNCFQLE